MYLFVKKLNLVFILTLIAAAVLAQDAVTLIEHLDEQGHVMKIKALEPGKAFNEKYEVHVSQPIDHDEPGLGTFSQRFFISVVDRQSPVVFVTEGYGAGYAELPGYQTELSRYLHANEIVVEHRYFNRSAPDSLDWTYLTVSNAAHDHHAIVELMKGWFTGKWVSTGISKGGQTALYHRSFFPDDVDATVGYVCPLNFSDEDLRIYSFLDEVGDMDCRGKIHDFQETMLRRKDACLPIFEKIMEKKGYHYARGIEAGYEFLVLEYSFAFWQWGTYDCRKIPASDTNPKKLVEHMLDITGLDWGSDEGIEGQMPFFYAAITELGMYGYDLDEFPGLITALDDQTFRFICPDGYDCEYNPEPMQQVDLFVRHEAENMIFIYGENDPWSATAVQWSGNPGVLVIHKPGGSHRTRIRNLPEDQRAQVFNALEEWLDVNIEYLPQK